MLLYVVFKIFSQPRSAITHSFLLLCLLLSAGLISQNAYAKENTKQELVSTDSEEIIQLPPVEVTEDTSESVQQDSSSNACRALLVSQDLEDRYHKIQKDLEIDYKEGVPHQLRIDLIQVRKNIDTLTVKLFDVDYNNSQEINHITQLTIDNLEKMISLLPKATKIAPKMRDRYVVPFTNINSMKAEYQDCLMQVAIEDIQNKAPTTNTEGASINIYKKLTAELEQLNKNLYMLQTTDVQRFIGYRAKLLADLERYNKSQANGFVLSNEIPQVLNTVHTEIERLLPGLELSKKYYSIVE